MPAEQSAWIRQIVWPPALQAAGQLTSWKAQCSCTRTVAQNSSSACSSGQHELCNWNGMLALRRIPEASLCIAQGRTHWIHLADVWEGHHAHYANCPCGCHRDQIGLFRLDRS